MSRDRIEAVKRHVMSRRGEHTLVGVQNALGAAYSYEVIRAAFQQLMNDPSSGVEARHASRVWSPGGGQQ